MSMMSGRSITKASYVDAFGQWSAKNKSTLKSALDYQNRSSRYALVYDDKTEAK